MQSGFVLLIVSDCMAEFTKELETAGRWSSNPQRQPT